MKKIWSGIFLLGLGAISGLSCGGGLFGDDYGSCQLPNENPSCTYTTYNACSTRHGTFTPV